MPFLRIFYLKYHTVSLIQMMYHFYFYFQMGEKMETVADPTTPMLFRLDFLRIICSHEHFFPLNLPFGTPLTPSAPCSPSPSVTSSASQSSYASTSTLTERGTFAELSLDFRTQHYLLGLVLADLSLALESQYVTQLFEGCVKHQTIQNHCTCTVFQILHS